MTTGRGRPAHVDPAARRHPGHRQARRARRPARRRQDRHDRQLRRRVVRRLHAAARRRGLGRVSRRAEAHADRVRRQARSQAERCRRMIWKAFMTAARQAARRSSRSSSRRRRTSRRRRSGSCGARARTSSTTATARARASSHTSRAAGRRRRPQCYANEVTVPLVIGKTVARRERGARASSRSARELIGVPAKPGKRPGLRRQAGAAERLPLGERHRPAVRHAARSALRAAAEPRRLERRLPRDRACGRSRREDDDHVRRRARPGSVLEQKPEPGVAAGRGLKVTLIVGRAKPSASPDHVAPRQRRPPS